ncbi:MAG: alpha-ketoacid dehydrogenase subunit beta [bacterium]|jgi:2-oxoisovalerate dehydrogenase E1 component beta subunit
MGHVATYIDAIVEAQREEMRRDERVFVMGEDVGIYGGVFKATKGLKDEFGFYRCLDTPISESLIVGAGIGAALMGMRPISEIQFADFIHGAHDQIVNQAAKIFYRTGGTWACPLVIRVPYGGDVGGGMYHSQSVEAWYVHVPGLKIVCPGTPRDAKGLLKAAVRDNNPVLYFEHKKLYRTIKEEIPDDDYVTPIGPAEVRREGRHVTMIAFGLMLQRVLKVAERLSGEGIEAEVIDLRTLLPMDKNTIIESAKKTGKVVVVHEAPKTGGVGGEIASIVAEQAFEYLDGPIVRVCGLDIPHPFHPKMEEFYLPSVERIYEETKKLVEY